MIKVYTEAIVKKFKNQTRDQEKSRQEILAELETASTRLRIARIMQVDGTLTSEDFNFLKEDWSKKIEILEKRLGVLSVKNKEVTELLAKCLPNLENIHLLYKNADLERKRQIVTSIFPENLVFDGDKHRTPRINEGLVLICLINNDLIGNQNGLNQPFSDLTRWVTPLRFEPI